MAGELASNYGLILNSLKEKIRHARIRAIKSVNAELLNTYWEIGKTILDQQEQQGWGTKIIKSLAIDLKLEFPDMKGLSIRNFQYMRAFAAAYPYFPYMQEQLAQSEKPGESIVQEPLAQLSWYHHITLINRVKEDGIRNFYIQKTIENGWSRNVLVHQIEAGLHRRLGALTSNFSNTIASNNSELVQQIFKDPYNFDFIQLGEKAKEKDVENALIQHITKVLLELGEGFAFMGRQFRLELGGQEYFLDLLFYHTKLRRYIVIELKIGDFVPEFAGKMNFYLSIVDDALKGPFDEPAIGLVLCKTKKKIIAEYALRDTNKPIGIAEYKLTEVLPENIKGDLPAIEEIEQRMIEELNDLKTPAEKKIDQLKEKLATLNRVEINTPATQPLLNEIFDKSIKPLYRSLFERLSFLNEEFISTSFVWYGSFEGILSLEELENRWKDGNTLIKTRDVKFVYRLSGLKKAGVDGHDIVIGLDFIMEMYWYGLTITNYNNGHPCTRKPYSIQLTQLEIENICDTITEQVIFAIEHQAGLLNNIG